MRNSFRLICIHLLHLLLSGYVRDNFGHPVPNAMIYVVENNVTVFSDSEGKYALPLEVNRYTVNISAAGYHKITKYLSVDDLNGIPDVVMFTLAKDSDVLGLPRIVFVLVLGKLGSLCYLKLLLYYTLIFQVLVSFY